MMKSETKKDLIVKRVFFFLVSFSTSEQCLAVVFAVVFFSLTCWCHLTSKTAYMRFHFLYLAS